MKLEKLEFQGLLFVWDSFRVLGEALPMRSYIFVNLATQILPFSFFKENLQNCEVFWLHKTSANALFRAQSFNKYYLSSS